MGLSLYRMQTEYTPLGLHHISDADISFLESFMLDEPSAVYSLDSERLEEYLEEGGGDWVSPELLAVLRKLLEENDGDYIDLVLE